MSEDNTLNDIRSSLIRKKERLNDINNAFKSLAVKERDPFKRLVSKSLSKYSKIMQDLFDNVELLAILNSGLKDQNNLLKDVLFNLSDVKNNPDLQSKIEEAFRRYEELYRKQQESFRRRQENLDE